MKIQFEFNTDSEDFSYTELKKFQDVDRMVSFIFDIEQKLNYWFNDEERNEIPVDEIVKELNKIQDKYQVYSDNYME